jgi:RNA polymerase sigma-70 factor (ECF subfamily)
MPRPEAWLGADESRLLRIEALIREHHAAVLRYVWRRAPRDFVDDVTADTFLVAWRRLDDVPTEPRAWLIGVARNVLATEARGARRREALKLRLRATYEPIQPAVDDDESPIGKAFERLSAKDRDVLMLVAVEGLTSAEAAAVLRLRPEAFRSRLTRAKHRLRRALEEVERDNADLPPDSLTAKETTR